MSNPRILVREGRSELTEEFAAVRDLFEQVYMPDASLVLFFCSPRYDLRKLGRALAATFTSPLVGCTTAGQIGQAGYSIGGITAVCLKSDELRATPYLISQLGDSREAAEVGYRAVAELVRRTSQRAFGLLLIDGLSSAEERVAAALHQAMGDVPLVGGSAADDLAFQETHVYHEGEFRCGAAVFVLFDTTLPFCTFKVQHVLPTEEKLVVTEADPDRRLVFELNGKLAAAIYAEKLGCNLAALDAAECARHPLLLSAGDEHFVRGVRSVNPDGSLSFWCAVEQGLVLTLGEETSAVDALREGFARVRSRIPSPGLVIGLDCVTRRLELERQGQSEAVGTLFREHHVVGFCTYGEQFDSLHVSQTFTGVALGGA